MKIWYLLMTFPCPAQTYAVNDVKALQRLGNTVSVHALLGPRADAAQLMRDEGIAGIEVTHGSVGSVVRGLFAVLSHPLRICRLLAWIIRHSGGNAVHLVKAIALVPRSLDLLEQVERECPDVVHIYWGHYPSIFGWLLLEYAPSVVVSLSLSAYDLLCDFPGSIAVARKAHVVSTWAGVNVPVLAKRGLPAETVYVSWQGVDLEQIKERRFAKVPRRIVTAARLVEEKGTDGVLHAFARVVAERPDASLVILGDGPDRPRLEKLAATLGLSQSVTFKGHVNHREVFSELAEAEVFLLFSRYPSERLPNVVKEAMACRCFVITTATPGIEELLEDGVHGRVVSPGAWEDAARLTIEAFAAPHEVADMANAAQRHIVEHFDVIPLMNSLARKWQESRAPGVA